MLAFLTCTDSTSGCHKTKSVALVLLQVSALLQLAQVATRQLHMAAAQRLERLFSATLTHLGNCKHSMNHEDQTTVLSSLYTCMSVGSIGGKCAVQCSAVQCSAVQYVCCIRRTAAENLLPQLTCGMCYKVSMLSFNCENKLHRRSKSRFCTPADLRYR